MMQIIENSNKSFLEDLLKHFTTNDDFTVYTGGAGQKKNKKFSVQNINVIVILTFFPISSLRLSLFKFLVQRPKKLLFKCF